MKFLCWILTFLFFIAPVRLNSVASFEAAAPSGPVDRLRVGLERIFSDVNFDTAEWGIKVVSLDHGDIIYERNAQRLYLPASNHKLLTVAAALVALGPDYHYCTRLFGDGVKEDGVFKGSIVVVGSGDPSFAARFHGEDPFYRFREWARRMKDEGIHSIHGALVGDDRQIIQPLGNGWGWDDLAYGYAAPVTALQFNESAVMLEIAPGAAPGRPAVIKSTPEFSYMSVTSEVLTNEPGSTAEIQVERGPDETVMVRGSVPGQSAPYLQSVAVRNPTLYFLTALKHTLQNEGIDVSGCVLRSAQAADPMPVNLLWEETSPPLSEIIKPLLKTSQNLYAETLVRTLGSALRGEGSFGKGKEVVEGTLEKMAVPKRTYSYADGSGLSRLNLVSADLLVRILKFMYRDKNFPAFYEALPIAGIDGTLSIRLKRTHAERNVRAKTGSMANVRSLSGYVRTTDGEMLAFSMIANNVVADGKTAEFAQDSALELLANFNRMRR